METVTQAKIERPVAPQLRPRLGLHDHPRLALTVDAPREPVRALSAHRAVNWRRADNGVAAGRKARPGPVRST